MKLTYDEKPLVRYKGYIIPTKEEVKDTGYYLLILRKSKGYKTLYTCIDMKFIDDLSDRDAERVIYDICKQIINKNGG